MGARMLSLLVTLWLAAACTADDSSAPSATPESTPTDSALSMTCAGEGTPTVVLEAGLNTSGATFAALTAGLAATTRVCYSDRAGVGDSPPLAELVEVLRALRRG